MHWSCGSEAPASSDALAPVGVALATALVVVTARRRDLAPVGVRPVELAALPRSVGVPQNGLLTVALLVPRLAALQACLDGIDGLAERLVHLDGSVGVALKLSLTVALRELGGVAHLLDAVGVQNQHAELAVRELRLDRLAFEVRLAALLVHLDEAVLAHLLDLDDALHGPAAAAVARAGDRDLHVELLQVGQADLLQALGVCPRRQLLAAEEDPEAQALVGVVGILAHQLLALLVALAGTLLLAGQGIGGAVLTIGLDGHCNALLS